MTSPTVTIMSLFWQHEKQIQQELEDYRKKILEAFPNASANEVRLAVTVQDAYLRWKRPFSVSFEG